MLGVVIKILLSCDRHEESETLKDVSDGNSEGNSPCHEVRLGSKSQSFGQ